MDWVVGLEQTHPYEFIQLEVFTEEDDAIFFAATWMAQRAGYKLAKRTWVVLKDDGPHPRLVVRRR